MTQSNLGKRIDSHEAVMRLNQAPVQPRYSVDVGERTTLRLLNKRWTAIYGRHHPELMRNDPDGVAGDMTVRMLASAAESVWFLGATSYDLR